MKKERNNEKTTADAETPLQHQPALAKAAGLKDLYLKREDKHSYGSHKGRSIPLMIDRYVAAGDRRFAISSSGNAALAATIKISELNSQMSDDKTSNSVETKKIELDIFVGQRVAPHKLEKLRKIAAQATNNVIRILSKERPLQALMAAIDEGARSLRQSTDDTSLIGYESLAREIADALPKGGAVFMGTSSGTTAQALAAYFIQHNGPSTTAPIQMHIVQTPTCHPMVDAFENYDGPDEVSTADAIVDMVAHRKTTLVPLIQKTDGRAWIATNDDIATAQGLALEHAIELSPNGALGLAGALKTAYIGLDTGGPVVCIVGGE